MWESSPAHCSQLAGAILMSRVLDAFTMSDELLLEGQLYPLTF
jgi:hypothetical protein